MDIWHTEALSSGVAPFIGLSAQAKLARFESAGASALHTLSPGYAAGTQGIGVRSAEVC